jgi:Bax protein
MLRRTIHIRHLRHLSLAALLVAAGLADHAPPVVAPAPAAAISGAAAASLRPSETASARRLDAAFGRLGYHLDAVERGSAVPRLALPKVPADLANLPGSEARKDVFLRLALPLVLMADEEIAADRRRLVALSERLNHRQALSREDQDWLDALADRYDVERGRRGIPDLLKRVDVVPPSLALGQAALESGWGTSKQVRRRNNLFGHTKESGSPARFPTLLDAVRAYLLNLNTHPAYRAMRQARAKARAKGKIPEGEALAAQLGAYSELGQAYVKQLRTMIRDNDLDRLDRARLNGTI